MSLKYEDLEENTWYYVRSKYSRFHDMGYWNGEEWENNPDSPYLSTTSAETLIPMCKIPQLEDLKEIEKKLEKLSFAEPIVVVVKGEYTTVGDVVEELWTKRHSI